MPLTEQVPDLTIDDVAPETLQGLTDGQLLAVHAAFAKMWLQHQENESFPVEITHEDFLTRFQFVMDEFGRRMQKDSDEQPGTQESFHLKGPHWIDPPESGPCPASHPNRDTSPDGKLKCYTRSAHASLLRFKMREQVEVPKLANEVLRLREKDFPDGRCGLCRYFDGPITCKILAGPVEAELVCDGFQGEEEGFPPYEVRDEDWLAFVNGMIEEQPYQHIVQSGHLTPEGPIVVIRDTMKPKAHIFSLSKASHISHTTSAHNWTQEEVDRLIKQGQSELQEAVVKSDFDNYFEIVDGKAKDLGNDPPTNLERLDGTPRFAIIEENRSTGRSTAVVLRDMTQRNAETRAREIVERQENPDLVTIVGREVGKVDERTIFKDLFGFRFREEERESLLTEAFHIRGIHWQSVPASGRCSGQFSVKAKFPGRELEVCFTPAAARAARAARSQS